MRLDCSTRGDEALANLIKRALRAMRHARRRRVRRLVGFYEVKAQVDLVYDILLQQQAMLRTMQTMLDSKQFEAVNDYMVKKISRELHDEIDRLDGYVNHHVGELIKKMDKMTDKGE
jgi:hypothetical protein